MVGRIADIFTHLQRFNVTPMLLLFSIGNFRSLWSNLTYNSAKFSECFSVKRCSHIACIMQAVWCQTPARCPVSQTTCAENVKVNQRKPIGGVGRRRTQTQTVLRVVAQKARLRLESDERLEKSIKKNLTTVAAAQMVMYRIAGALKCSVVHLLVAT